MGTAAFGAIGSAIGGEVAGAFGSQLGWVAGTLVGTYLFAPPGPDLVQEGTRLDDLKVTSSTYGASVPKLFGSYRLSGNVIWAKKIRETKHEESQDSGKGLDGGTSTTIWYTYDATWAVAFCEGPIDGIRKIWFDSILVYENGKSEIGDRITIYNGTDDQEVDWVIQSDREDNPAYRNIVYVVFNEVKLKKYGDRIPNVTCEAVIGSSNERDVYHTVTGEINFSDTLSEIMGIDFDAGVNKDFVFNSPSNSMFFVATRTDPVTRLITDSVLAKVNVEGRIVFYKIIKPQKYEYSIGDGGLVLWSDNANVSADFFVYDDQLDLISSQTLLYYNIDTDTYWAGGEGFFVSKVAYTDKKLIWMVRDYTTQFAGGIYVNGDKVIDGADLTDIYPRNGLSAIGGKIVLFSDRAFAQVGDEYKIRVYETTGDLDFEMDYKKYKYSEILSINNATTQFKPTENGIIVACSFGWDNGRHHWLIDTNDADAFEYLGANKPSGDEGYGDAKGGFYSSNINYILDSTWGVVLANTSALLTSQGIRLSDLCYGLLIESGLDDVDLDMTEGKDTIVSGYVVSKNMPARTAIEPVLSAYEFTLVEINSTMKLREQNQISLANIPEDDLGADGNNKMEYNSSQEMDLLKSLTIKFSNRDSDYQTGVQSVRRIDTDATTERVMELPLALSDKEAKELAEKNLYKNWLMRQSYKFVVPYKYRYLIPGDVVTVSFDGYVKDVRLTKIIFTDDFLVECNGIANNYGVYNSDAEADSTGENGGELDLTSFSTYNNILDAPTLNNKYVNVEGVYSGLYSFSDNWKGGVLMSKSLELDNFAINYTTFEDMPSGVSSSSLPDASTDVWDRVNVLKVYSSGILESKTEEQLLAGENYILLGREVLQYANATEISLGIYELDTLLRGRLGTEFETGSHSGQEVFAYLDRNALYFTSKPMNSNDLYASVNLTSNITSVSNQKRFYYSGINLRPYSPAYLRYSKYLSNINIKWMRRSRYVTGYMNTVPVVDNPELYEIDVESFGVIYATYEASSTSFLYTETMAIDDGIDYNEPIKFMIYQVASIYGRGKPSEITAE